ncbi:MAG: MOSC domain-containing protein [Candidatus Devosia phytovorans]|uniref:MOSC domain-containing protein n=1 Tax=Candidatus Devosia phytovorans TaxID=3121372 RepID=A0AAJ6AZD1_9HYPH|nr:MOSC domain-containing protein [Devosia sp.]WEK04460.1 MAG: MOSC domain-containing protein [Devosia sp.]
MANLLSVNRGTAQHIEGYKPLTGIVKRPQPSAEIDAQGIKDDAICDRKHHGGVDQAIYIYFADDYQFWADELGRRIEPGTFGDNLTISGVEGGRVAVGDRFTIGPVVMEVTSHRTPCMTFAAQMGDRGFVKRFHRAGRPGAYCRVIIPGTVETGMDVTVTPYQGARITVAELMALDGKRQLDPDFMRRALTAPVHYKMRADYEDKLASLF